MEEDGPLNVYAESRGLLPMLTSRDPDFEEALDWLQSVYNAYQSGDYVAPASTILAQSAIVEGDKTFPEIIQHLRRMYPEVYGTVVSLGWAPARSDLPLRETGAGLSSVNLVNNRFSKLGAYIGRFNNFSPSTAR